MNFEWSVGLGKMDHQCFTVPVVARGQLGSAYVEFPLESGMHSLDTCNPIPSHEIGLKFTSELILKSYGRDCARKWDMVAL